MRKFSFSFGIFSIGILLFIFIDSNYKKSSGKVFEKNEIAPEIELYNLKGKKIKLSKLRGKLVLIDFGPRGVGHAEKRVLILLRLIISTINKNLKMVMVLKSLVFPWIKKNQRGSQLLSKMDWFGNIMPGMKRKRQANHMKSSPFHMPF